MQSKILALLAIASILTLTALYFGGFISVGEASERSTEEGKRGDLDSRGNSISTSESLYLPLDPPFVVNFTHLGALRYLQTSIVVMYSNQDLLDEVTAHMPAIRNELILLLSNQKFERLSSLSGKEEIRTEMIAAINHLILTDEGSGSDGEIFFTNFVMQ